MCLCMYLCIYVYLVKPGEDLQHGGGAEQKTLESSGGNEAGWGGTGRDGTGRDGMDRKG